MEDSGKITEKKRGGVRRVLVVKITKKRILTIEIFKPNQRQILNNHFNFFVCGSYIMGSYINFLLN